MKKILKISLIVFASLVMLNCFFVTPAKAAEDSAGINFLTNVLESISLSVSSASLDFGNLSAGTPARGNGGVTAGVRTNSGFGYSLSINDNNSGNKSALRHSDAVTYISDFLDGTITTPALWSSGSSVGFGFSVFAADTGKEAKWGTGTTYSDANNKYAGIPQNATVFHNSSGFKNGLDNTSLAFVVDVLADQKSGAYSGVATLTAVSLFE
jgi:hypothetical protein